MREIFYDERSSFYFDEINTCEDNTFLKSILLDNNIDSVLDIPCGTGRNILLLSENCKKVYLCDLEIEMINKVNSFIHKNHIKNCKAFVGDLYDYHIDFKPEATIVMRQALQFISPRRLKNAIKNMINNTKKLIVLDVYDFCSTAPDGQVPSYILSKSKSFKFNDDVITRRTMINYNSDSVDIKYIYCMNKQYYFSKITLYSYSPEYVVDILKQYNVTNIKEYRDYKFNVRTNEKSSIMVIEIGG